MVDVPFGDLHQNDLASGQVVAMTSVGGGRKRIEFIYDVRIVDFKNRVARAKRLLRKYSKTID